MSAEEAKDPLKDVDWKSMSDGRKNVNDKVENGQPIVKKRLPKKIRQIPESYFLPRRSLPSAIAFYGSFIVAGVGAGMLLEVWINKKVKGIVTRDRGRFETRYGNRYAVHYPRVNRRMEELSGSLANEAKQTKANYIQFLYVGDVWSSSRKANMD